MNEAQGEDAIPASELVSRFNENWPKLESIDVAGEQPRYLDKRRPRESSQPPTSLDNIGLEILRMAAQAPEERGWDSVSVDEIVEELRIPKKVAEYQVKSLAQGGLLTRDGDEVEITDAGTKVLIDKGFL